MEIQEMKDEGMEHYVDATLERGSYLRKIGVWPASDVFYEEWLSNFEGSSDRYIASKILNNFLYYSKPMVVKLLHDAVGGAVSLIARNTRPIDRGFYKSELYYSYVPGEKPNPTDSGYLFMRKLRDDLHIRQERIFEFDKLKLLLQTEGVNRKLQIVLCDDFVGSGNQCIKALKEVTLDNFGMSICEFAQKFGHTIAYAPLIANKFGADRIRRELPNVLFTPVHVLGDEYSLFSEQCVCWNGEYDLYCAGVELIRRVSGNLGISDDNGEVSVRGFGGQGLFVGFEHGIPDSDPAFFFYVDKGWKPLMGRSYARD